jgi:hypothetical protein
VIDGVHDVQLLHAVAPHTVHSLERRRRRLAAVATRPAGTHGAGEQRDNVGRHVHTSYNKAPLLGHINVVVGTVSPHAHRTVDRRRQRGSVVAGG